MSEKIVRIYDGVKYKDVTYSEILDGDGNPTGRYKTLEEQEVTDLGTWLDQEQHYELLKKYVDGLSEKDDYSNYLGLITDEKGRYFLLSRMVRYEAQATPVDSWFEWVILILSQLGYVNDEYVVHYDDSNFPNTPTSIDFIITPKDGSPKFKAHLFAMDDHSYLFPLY